MTNAIVIADMHAHVYPCYPQGEALRRAFINLTRAAPDATVRLLALAERGDCSFFRDVKSGRLPIPGFERIDVPDDPWAVAVKDPTGALLYIVAGRQLVTKERIELVALTRDDAPAEGAPAGDMLQAIRTTGAVPCINWAPGKWFGGRGEIIASLIREGQPGDFVLGDTTLRPTLWSEPRLMAEAGAQGFTIIAGSDPLPFPGEETKPGQYASRWIGPFDPTHPSESLRQLLKQAPQRLGHRDGVVTFARRWWSNQRGRSA